MQFFDFALCCCFVLTAIALNNNTGCFYCESSHVRSFLFFVVARIVLNRASFHSGAAYTNTFLNHMSFLHVYSSHCSIANTLRTTRSLSIESVDDIMECVVTYTVPK